MNLNIKAQQQNTYDAIVVGTGISGGWAAKELTEKGLKTLVLERGRDVVHPNYPTATKEPWQFPNGGRPTVEDLKNQFKQHRTGYTTHPSTKHWFVNDLENPYSEKEGKRFDWMRGYHVGGRSIMWGRHSYRWSDLDFTANAKDGIAIDWPVRYADIKPWYDYVETYIGVTGQPEGLPQLPDGVFQPPMEMNCLEKEVRKATMEKFGRVMTIGRIAHITDKLTHDKSPQRGSCQYRNLCSRGCPYGAYFSSNSSTLPAAMATNNMTLRPNSIVHQLIVDESTGKATGVRVKDAETGEDLEFSAKVIFLCASTMGSTYIMMNSISKRFPNGFGNDSGELGHNIMDHHLGVGAAGEYDGFEDQYYSGRRANSLYVPRFRNLPGQEKREYLRGFGYQGGASRQNWSRMIAEMSIGPALKEEVTTPGKWTMGLGGFGEILPYHENYVEINKDVKDKHGLPTLTFDTVFRENEFKMRKDMANDAAEMLEAAGLKNVKPYDRESQHGIGLGIHEMGTARMGKDPKTSVLNKWNQVHASPNVYVTDGSFMTSAACVNPSLTYMAFTARAVDHAVSEFKKQNI